MVNKVKVYIYANKASSVGHFFVMRNRQDRFQVPVQVASGLMSFAYSGLNEVEAEMVSMIVQGMINQKMVRATQNPSNFEVINLSDAMSVSGAEIELN